MRIVMSKSVRQDNNVVEKTCLDLSRRLYTVFNIFLLTFCLRAQLKFNFKKILSTTTTGLTVYNCGVGHPHEEKGVGLWSS